MAPCWTGSSLQPSLSLSNKILGGALAAAADEVPRQVNQGLRRRKRPSRSWTRPSSESGRDLPSSTTWLGLPRAPPQPTRDSSSRTPRSGRRIVSRLPAKGGAAPPHSPSGGRLAESLQPPPQFPIDGQDILLRRPLSRCWRESAAPSSSATPSPQAELRPVRPEMQARAATAGILKNFRSGTRSLSSVTMGSGYWSSAWRSSCKAGGLAAAPAGLGDARARHISLASWAEVERLVFLGGSGQGEGYRRGSILRLSTNSLAVGWNVGASAEISAGGTSLERSPSVETWVRRGGLMKVTGDPGGGRSLPQHKGIGFGRHVQRGTKLALICGPSCQVSY